MAMLLALDNFHPYSALPEGHEDLLSTLERGVFSDKEAERFIELSGMNILRDAFEKASYKIHTITHTKSKTTLIIAKVLEGHGGGSIKEDQVAFQKISFYLQKKLSEKGLDPTKHELRPCIYSEDLDVLKDSLFNYYPSW